MEGVLNAASRVSAEGVVRTGMMMYGASVGATATASVVVPFGLFAGVSAIKGNGGFVKGAIPTILGVGTVCILAGTATGAVIGAYAPHVILKTVEVFLNMMK
jgi:hypothetical protein